MIEQTVEKLRPSVRAIWALLVLALAGSAQAADVKVPDVCTDGICLTELRWKKGVFEHTLSGFVGPVSGVAESVSISLAYNDNRKKGTGLLNLRAVAPHTPFYFKVNSLFVSWDQSEFVIGADAILGIAPAQKDGLVFKFASLGSRLSISILNKDVSDVVLEYQLLTLSAAGQNLPLNGGHGKYADMATPATPALIVAGTEHKDEFLAVGSTSFEGGNWNEDWRLQGVLMDKNPVLTVPLGPLGSGKLVKIALDVRAARVSAQGAVPAKK